MKRNNKKGFTLTEMIVVIAIIGILAGVLIPTIIGYVNKARLSNDQQVAASMTDEIERYCIENNVNQNKLSGIDVRTILIAKEYNMVPSMKEWSYFYNESTREVEVIKFKDLTAQAGGAYDDLTEIVKGYYLVGKGETDIEVLVSELVNGRYDYYTSNTTKAAGYNDYEDMLENYSYDKTIYINAGSVLNGNLDSTYSNIVFCELVNFIPNLTIDKAVLETGYKVENANILFAVEGNGNLAEIVGIRSVKKLNLASYDSHVEANDPSSAIANFESKLNLKNNSSASDIISAGGFLTESEVNSLVFTVGEDITESNYQLISFGVDNEIDKLKGIWKMSVLFMGADGVVGYKEIYFER